MKETGALPDNCAFGDAQVQDRKSFIRYICAANNVGVEEITKGNSIKLKQETTQKIDVEGL
jgi:hypothetical protein